MSCFGVYTTRDGAAQALKPGLYLTNAVVDGKPGHAVVTREDRGKIVHWSNTAPPGERLKMEVPSE